MKRMLPCLALLAACKSEETKLSDLLDRAASSTATAAAVARTTIANRTPTRYADNTFDESRRDLASALASMDGFKARPDIRQAAARTIQSAQSTIDAVRRGLDAHARDLSPEVATLSAGADSLSSLADRAKQPSR